MGAPVKARISSNLLSVIRGEYREMPGMRLTRAQFQRLWALDEAECEQAVRELIADGFLGEDVSGRFHRTIDLSV
jgi:hypothetical protein